MSEAAYETDQYWFWQPGQRRPPCGGRQPGIGAHQAQEAKERGAAIDATYGRRTQAVLIMDSDHVVLSAFPPEKLLARAEDGKDPAHGQ